LSLESPRSAASSRAASPDAVPRAELPSCPPCPTHRRSTRLASLDAVARRARRRSPPRRCCAAARYLSHAAELRHRLSCTIERRLARTRPRALRAALPTPDLSRLLAPPPASASSPAAPPGLAPPRLNCIGGEKRVRGRERKEEKRRKKLWEEKKGRKMRKKRKKKRKRKGKKKENKLFICRKYD
jgi:hypothetical protein